jgi:oxygen-independent coproporphyrinogen-3 oxidase
MSNKLPISIYVDWPFCDCKHGVNETLLGDSYLKELSSFKKALEGKRVKSIFFGGGNILSMNIGIIEKILGRIGKLANIDIDAEITAEISPGFVDKNKLASLEGLGVNRVSIGVQAFNDSDLKALGLIYSKLDAVRAIELVEKNFGNYSLDLVYARPAQSLENWQTELSYALQYIKHHVSLNQFITDESKPGPDLEAEMFKFNQEILESNGIYQYEISNYAINGKESVHALAYYNYDEYLGIGPGATSRIIIDGNMFAISIEEDHKAWLEKLNKDLETIIEKENLSHTQVAYEYIMMNIRKAKGMDISDFRFKFNRDIYKYIDTKALNSFQINGLLDYNNEKILVTKSGRIFLDKIITDIISDSTS